VRELRPDVEACVAIGGAEVAPSYFEFMTALALRYFARAGCHIALVEVGMGGRLDATNVVTPEVSVITSIGLDHCEFLGSSVEAIAGEKAGIIKSGRSLVLGRIPLGAERVIRSVAVAHNAPVFSVQEVFGDDVTRYPRTNLVGDFQRVNAATATLAARRMPVRWRLTDAVIEQALLDVEWAGRWQSLTVEGRTVIVDASHNPEGAVGLDANLARLREETGKAPVVVTGVLGAARAKPLLEAICRHANRVLLVVPRQSRACSQDELVALLPPDYRGEVVRTSLEAVLPGPGRCEVGAATEQPVVFTGSIYLAGEVLARLDPARGPVESELQDF
jgi:dihydrofolate synthase/folylpolyglutamate synthase